MTMLAAPEFQWVQIGRCIHCGEAFYQQGNEIRVKWNPECEHEMEEEDEQDVCH